MSKRTFTNEQFIEAVKLSTSLRQILTQLNLKEAGGNYKTIKNLIIELNLDTSHRTICFTYHKKECIICKEQNIVTVHHYDENHLNNDPSNLIPLCPTHHQYVHSRFKDLVIKEVDAYVEQFKQNAVL